MFLVLAILWGGAFSAPALAAELFQLGEKKYERKDLNMDLQSQVYEADREWYEQLEEAVAQQLVKMHAQEIARKKKQSVEEVLANLLQVPPPTEKEVKAFYEKNKQRVPSHVTYEQLKPEMEKIVFQEKAQAKQDALVAKIKKEKKFKMLLPEPVPPVLTIPKGMGYARGPESAKVTVYEFADYACGQCRQHHQDFEKLFAKYKDKIRLVYIDYPLAQMGLSRQVAQGAHCAFQQGPKHYWKYHKLAFTEELKESSALDFAKKIVLDLKKFERCTGSAGAIAAVEKMRELGTELGVTTTPFVLINGQKLTEEPTFSNLDQAVSKAL